MLFGALRCALVIDLLSLHESWLSCPSLFLLPDMGMRIGGETEKRGHEHTCLVQIEHGTEY